MKFNFKFLAVLLLAGCTTAPPNNPNDACSIAKQYPDWYYDSLDSYKKWGVPVSVQWAFIRKESSFIADAQTPMRYVVSFIPTGRQSTAYGYAQALDGTWDEYQKETCNSWASRTSFADAVDFIGWYADYADRIAGISKSNAYQLYLAYNQGVYGYMKKSYRNNRFLIKYARETQDMAYLYAYQLRRCNVTSKSWFW